MVAQQAGILLAFPPELRELEQPGDEEILISIDVSRLAMLPCEGPLVEKTKATMMSSDKLLSNIKQFFIYLLLTCIFTVLLILQSGVKCPCPCWTPA